MIAFQDKLENAGTSQQHVAEQVSILKAFIELGNPESAANVDQESVQSYLSSLRKKGRSKKKKKKHLASLRTFFEWMIDTGNLAQNPTRGIKKPSPERDRKHKRRMLTREEWTWLASTTAKEKERWKMIGPARHLLYWTAIETGYRSNELRQIVKADLGHHDDLYFICLASGNTKNGNAAKQYISQDLAEKLVEHSAGLGKANQLFNMPAKANVVKMLRSDLSSGRQAWHKEVENDPIALESRRESDFLVYEDQQNFKLDFHALRHTCGAWLIIAGVDVKTVQTIMRHSNPTLTLNTYGHLLNGAESKAVETLNAGAQQICSKLSAAEGILDAIVCESNQQMEELDTKKDPGKTEVSASGCEPVQLAAKAPLI